MEKSLCTSATIHVRKTTSGIAKMYQSAGMEVQATRARETALYAEPTWERFETCLKDVSMETLRSEKLTPWTFSILQLGQIGLVCRMLWFASEREDAWRVFSKSRISAYSVDEDLRHFLAVFADYDSSRCIAVYRGFVDECIARKSRR